MTASRVGREGPRCGARLRQSEGTCRKEAGWGTNHVGAGPCRLHGGSTRSVSKGAHRKLLDREAAAQLAQLDVKPVTDPLSELMNLAGQVIAWRDVLAEKVNELTTVRREDDRGGEQLRSEVALFERAMDRCLAVLSAMAKLNIEERHVRLAEEQGHLVAEAVKAILGDLDLTPEQHATARTAVPRRLRELVA